jgi:hypothetical protein
LSTRSSVPARTSHGREILKTWKPDTLLSFSGFQFFGGCVVAPARVSAFLRPDDTLEIVCGGH